MEPFVEDLWRRLKGSSPLSPWVSQSCFPQPSCSVNPDLSALVCIATALHRASMEWQQRGDRHCHHSPPGKNILPPGVNRMATAGRQGGMTTAGDREEYCHHTPPGMYIATTFHQESMEWQHQWNGNNGETGRNTDTTLHQESVEWQQRGDREEQLICKVVPTP